MFENQLRISTHNLSRNAKHVKGLFWTNTNKVCLYMLVVPDIINIKWAVVIGGVYLIIRSHFSLRTNFHCKQTISYNNFCLNKLLISAYL